MIGVIGLGNMGRGIALTLLRDFRDVMVCDIDPDRVVPLVTAGATAADAVSDLARQCDVIITSLPSSTIAIRVLEDDLVPAVTSGTIVIDMGTTIVRETRRVASLLASRDAYLVDAPCSGGPSGTAKGTLYTFVGGDGEAAQKVWPILRLLSSSRLTYCGPSGAGQITKGVNQLVMGLVNAALVEAVAYGESGGVDPATLLEAIGGTSGFRREFASVASQIAAGQGDRVNFKYSELEYFLDHADEAGFAAPITRSIKEYLTPYPHDQIDNINRSYPSLWGALTDRTQPVE